MPRPLSLSLRDHVVPWRSLPWPIDWSSVFGRGAPLVLEIGFGNGQFLLEQAAEHPERDHVGLELSWSGATRLFQRLDKAGVRNARAVLVDAEVALVHLLRPSSLAEVFVNHPCPWPKARHAGRRILQPEFLALLADRMQAGARLTVVTDHAEYAAFVTENLEAQAALVSCHPTTEVAAIPGRKPTKYQAKAMAEGIPIHFFEWRKERAPDPVPPPPIPLAPHDDAPPEGAGRTPMPSMSLRGATGDADLFDGFEPVTVHETPRGVETVVRLSNVYRGLRAAERPATWLVEVLTQEDALRQEFALLVVRRPSGDLLLKLSGLGRPHPTHAVKRAVERLGRWLLERHPDLELVHENLGQALQEDAE